MDRLEIANRISKLISDNPIDGKPMTSYKLEKLGIISSSTLSNTLTGKVRPNRSSLSKLADFYHVSIEWIMTGNDEDHTVNNAKSDNFMELITKLSNSIESKDRQIEKLLQIIDRLTAGTSPACGQENDVSKTGRNRDND